ncbi:MAG: hypothetical protein GF317_08765 [Candidatus Lokiarchaeota archaeon]|nr:hypothetical protein [Candidatus Lokiarchaeota archaeon]
MSQCQYDNCGVSNPCIGREVQLENANWYLNKKELIRVRIPLSPLRFEIWKLFLWH